MSAQEPKGKAVGTREVDRRAAGTTIQAEMEYKRKNKGGDGWGRGGGLGQKNKLWRL